MYHSQIQEGEEGVAAMEWSGWLRYRTRMKPLQTSSDTGVTQGAFVRKGLSCTVIENLFTDSARQAVCDTESIIL